MTPLACTDRKGSGHIAIKKELLHRHHVRVVLLKKMPCLIINPLQSGRNGQGSFRPDTAVIQGIKRFPRCSSTP